MDEQTSARRLRDAIQKLLDDAGDGWMLSQYVICMGLERIHNGHTESTPWYWTPPEQPEWMTTALLDAALDQHATADIEDD